ncbi:hypothetical protein [Candidatus Kryptobacter tengchongensis]|uniref:Uncharacterized protein n=1 Tax=Kryptobacter tengchongensis TaxID=1643429 RepID=A0A916LL70_KRYT1|nr:hypothetical protein [Candidatus Kryptobacter tengchongensis]CUT05784.1 hypothetical protein JGI25_01650 [Candidatus Kryptobacter tengchongensis]
MKSFDADVFLGIVNGQLSMSLNSSLDKQLSSGFREAVGKEIEQLKNEAESMARAKLEEIRREFELKIDEKIKELTNKADEYKNIVTLVENLREQKLKELDQEIKKRGTKILENILRK